MPNTSKTIKTANCFLHLPERGANGQTTPTVVFFITGNPGLISYYHEFLGLLCQEPSSTISQTPDEQPRSARPSIAESCVVAGFSLGGFDLPVDSSAKTTFSAGHTTGSQGGGDDSEDVWIDDELDELQYPSSFQRKDIYGLQDQIELCYARLARLVGITREHYTDSPNDNQNTMTNVILAGHSVGAYIALEATRLHHTHATPTFRITTALLLTPTILNIAHSPSGRLATPLLTTLPFLPSLAQLGSSTLTALLPTPRLTWLVSRITGMPPSSRGLTATVSFLQSRSAVRQALHLAAQEMQTIKGNEWGEEVWGVVEGKAPKMYFWFARGDHWVAEATREEIRALVREGTEVVVDEDQGLVHAWCIEQSGLVAGRVRVWLERALEGGM